MTSFSSSISDIYDIKSLNNYDIQRANDNPPEASLASRGAYEYSNQVVNPFRFARSCWRVIQDLSRTEDFIILQATFAQSRWLSWLAKWDQVTQQLSSDVRIKHALETRPRLGWIDLTRLAELPPGSLGKTLAEHMTQKELNPNIVAPLPAVDAASFVMAHFVETHDIWHVVTGYGSDKLGEISLFAFYAAQFQTAPHIILGLGVMLLNTIFFQPSNFRQRLDAFQLGWRTGMSANSLFGYDWAQQWSRPLPEIRKNLCLPEHPTVVGEGIQTAARATL
ncbi:Coq4 family protein [Leptothoe spongobia]|uniref:Ubiquinone biosynthesis protein n=1 Tax=Leptothoe spongobia TAU-MAC 1115 TaxID=1967444 RepID=A0A947GET6_9CYAN|nr:Coq4 family protein [Leptothoe spongobia]MBT9314050.1 hypothetical protein [Leptothoe spongobia TAU-MAC 1115]